jgi:hypothetical protein
MKGARRHLVILSDGALIVKMESHTFWWGCGEIGALRQWGKECEMVEPLWPPKLKVGWPHNPMIVHLGIYLRDLEDVHPKCCTWRLHVIMLAAFIFNRKRVGINQIPSNWWMAKQNKRKTIVRPSEGTKYWCMLQYRWTLERCKVKENSPKRPHMVWLSLHETSRISNYAEMESSSLLGPVGSEGALGELWGS